MRFLAATLLLASVLGAAEPPAPRRVMAIGDSITQGGGATFATYRVVLAAKLQAAGLRCHFVGSQVTATPHGPLRHEGYGGKNAEFLAGILEAKLTAAPADILMIQAGPWGALQPSGGLDTAAPGRQPAWGESLVAQVGAHLPGRGPRCRRSPHLQSTASGGLIHCMECGCQDPDLNWGHGDFQSPALPTELSRPVAEATR